MIRLTINGDVCELGMDCDMPLLWVLRDHLHLCGTKYGCGVGICGICTVLADGKALRSCVVPIKELEGQRITTIEGLSRQGHRVLNAWLAEQVPQCGYCQPGQIMAAAALLNTHPRPAPSQIHEALDSVLCRCGSQPRIRRAVQRAATLSAADVERIAAPLSSQSEGVSLDPWITLSADNRVVLTINHAEMGQGVNSGLAALIAEELEVDLRQVETRFAPAQPRYRNPMFGEQTTGGSTSVRGEWRRLSEAGARARQRLLKAAAQHWHVAQKECAAEHGAIVHRRSGRRLLYSELTRAAKRIKPPRRVKLKRPGDYRLLGHNFARLEIPGMLTGRTCYGFDVQLPGMRLATVQRCPWLGGRVRDYDESAVHGIPGVEAIFPISNGVAVVARDSWAAIRAKQALKVDWIGQNISLDSQALYRSLESVLDGRHGEVREQKGRAQHVLEQAVQIIEAEYTLAPVAHAALEPVNCTVVCDTAHCELWLGTQSPEAVRDTAARVSGLPKSRVQVHSLFTGGAFGRRLDTDMVVEAVEIAKAVDYPIKLIWTRIDDMQHDHFRPAMLSRMRAVLDDKGWPLAWEKRSAASNVAGQAWEELPYSIDHIHGEFIETDSLVPDGAWRAVGAGQDAFVVESFIDELAAAAETDPLEFRLSLLNKSPRYKTVLQHVAAKAEWHRPPPAHRFRGVALYRSFGSYVAQIAELSVANKHIQVHKVVCVIDCGRIVSPDAVRAQIEGGIVMGISVALNEQITIDKGRIQQETFEDYPILTLSEVPEIEVHILDSAEEPGGVGEPGVPPVAPAIANAIAAATGQRIRQLPIRLA